MVAAVFGATVYGCFDAIAKKKARVCVLFIHIHSIIFQLISVLPLLFAERTNSKMSTSPMQCNLFSLLSVTDCKIIALVHIFSPVDLQFLFKLAETVEEK